MGSREYSSGVEKIRINIGIKRSISYKLTINMMQSIQRFNIFERDSVQSGCSWRAYGTETIRVINTIDNFLIERVYVIFDN